jgi:hypothetical protein
METRNVTALVSRDLGRVVEILGLNQTARILDVDRALQMASSSR